ncbi:MAG: hypothetical protein AB7S26_03595 [Sandaracinaceae bacterium]
MNRTLRLGALFLLIVAGCDESTTTGDAGTARDGGGARDGGTGTREDGGSDAGSRDGGGMTDAGSGMSDAGADPFSTDRGLFFGAARCNDSFLLCEDFESGAIDGARWNERSYMSAAEVATDEAARGTHAYHVTLGTTPGSNVYLEAGALLLPVAGNHFFGRAFFRIARQPDARTDGAVTIHWNLVEATGPASIGGTTYRPLVRWGGILRNHPDLDDQSYLFNYEMPGSMRPPGFSERGAGGPLSPKEDWLDVWTCAEWELDGDASEGRFWSDGVAIDELHVMDEIGGDYITMPTPFETIRIGWQHYQPIASAYEVWIDEIVIDDERVGCVR